MADEKQPQRAVLPTDPPPQDAVHYQQQMLAALDTGRVVDACLHGLTFAQLRGEAPGPQQRAARLVERALAEDRSDDLLHSIGVQIPSAFANPVLRARATAAVELAYGRAAEAFRHLRLVFEQDASAEVGVRLIDSAVESADAELVAEALEIDWSGILSTHVAMRLCRVAAESDLFGVVHQLAGRQEVELLSAVDLQRSIGRLLAVEGASTPPPESGHRLADRCRVAGWSEHAEDWPAAASAWAEVAEEDPAALVLLGEAFANSGNLDSAEETFRRAGDNDRITADAGLARLLARRFRFRDATAMWRAIVSSDESRYHSWLGLAGALRQAGDFDGASAALDRAVPGRPTPLQRLHHDLANADLLASQYRFDEARALASDVVERTDFGPVRRRALRTMTRLRLDADGPAAGASTEIAFLESELADSPTGARFELLVALCDLYVFVGAADAATDFVDEVVRHAPREDALRFRAWSATMAGEHSVANATAEQWIGKRFRPHIHAPVAGLDGMAAVARAQGTAPTVIGVVRDEMLRLPDYLRHHRSLGFERFVLVDNNSGDGTTEFLRSQPDVLLVTTTNSFVEAGYGVRWLNEVVHALPAGTWVTFADADEQLVYRDFEHRSIADVVADLEIEGCDAVGGFMVDMHPESIDAESDYVPGTPMVDHSPLFTNSYETRGQTGGPYVDVRGGFRASILGVAHRQQTKTPLVKCRPDFWFLSSSHVTTPVKLAKANAVLLHFKFVGDSLDRARSEAAWEGSAYFTNRQSDYERLDTSMVESTADVVRFACSDDLLEAGLLR